MAAGAAAGIDNRLASREQARRLVGLGRRRARHHQIVGPGEGRVERSIQSGYHFSVRRLLPAVVLLLVALPGVAQAATRQLRIFQDDRMLVYSGPVVRAAVLDQAKELGVDVIRVQFVWRNIALSKPAQPSDPASYGTAWSSWDSLALEAHKRGMKVLATVTGPAPTWAAGSTGTYYMGSRYPDPNQFGQFMAAVGRRYSGHAKASVMAIGSSTRPTGVAADSVAAPV